MEHHVIFRDNQETQADDFNNLQSWATQSIDDVVVDAIEPGNAYAGFIVSKSAQTTVTVAAGRLYIAGVVYGNEQQTVLDLYNLLPVNQYKQIAIVGWGSTVDEDVQDRDFIIDADTGQSQPQQVSMEETRYCNVGTVAGIEAAQPNVPTINATQTLIAYVYCDPTGIVSVQQYTANQIDSVADLAQRAQSLETWQSQITGSVNTLQTALANLAGQLSNYVLTTDYVKLVTLVNEIVWKLANPPVSYEWFGTDYFLDTTQSDTAGNVDGAYSALVQEGLRFPGSAAATVAAPGLILLNPSDPSATFSNADLMLPTPSGARVRLDCSFPNLPWIPESILQYTYFTFNARQLTPARKRHCCGYPYVPAPSNQVWWYQAQNDPTTHILSFASESWEAAEWAEIAAHANEDSVDWPQHSFDRFQYLWRDYTDQEYWAKVSNTYAHSGQHIAQTFLNSQDGWLTGISLYMTKLYAQPLTVIIAQCDDDGTPDPDNKTIGRLVADGTAMTGFFNEVILVGDIDRNPSLWGSKVDPIIVGNAQNQPQIIYPCRIEIQPTFLKAGKRYAIHCISTYDHSFSISDQWDCYNVHQGDYWVTNSGGLYRWTTSPRSLRFKLHYATWGQWQSNPTSLGSSTVRTEIQLQPLQKSGGINGVEVLANMIEPAATSVTYEVQVSSNWVPFGPDPNEPTLSGNPALLPFRVTMTGTTDLMPAVSLANSQVTLRGPAAASFHHISNDVTLGITAIHGQVIARIQGFDGAHHTLAASLHYSSTHKTADVVADLTMPDGSLQRTWTFNSISATDLYVELDGTTDGTGNTFIVNSASRYASAT